MTKIVGILNITPDSFSDGGLYNTKKQILNRAQAICQEGAKIIDIGAESTRPSYQQKNISPEEEWDRINPYLSDIIAICREHAVTVSIDTRNYFTAKNALEKGVDWINDVSGAMDNNLISMIAANNMKIVIMHNLGVPPSKDIVIDSDYPEKIIYQWFENKIEQLNQFNISNNQIIIDPGIGFGNTPSQAFRILKNIDLFKKFNSQILIGHSRKSMFNICNTLPAHQRDIETLSISTLLAYQNIDFIRVHNIIDHVRMLKVIRALNGE